MKRPKCSAHRNRPAFAARDGRREDRMTVAVGGIAGRGAEAHERGQDVIALLLVGRQQAILDQEGFVSPSVAGRNFLFRAMDLGAAVRNPGGKSKDQFGVLKWDQFQSFAAPVIVGGLAMR